jgi:hypothetical protein
MRDLAELKARGANTKAGKSNYESHESLQSYAQKLNSTNHLQQLHRSPRHAQVGLKPKSTQYSTFQATHSMQPTATSYSYYSAGAIGAQSSKTISPAKRLTSAWQSYEHLPVRGVAAIPC